MMLGYGLRHEPLDAFIESAFKAKKRVAREYTKADEKELRAHSKAKTPVAKIVKLTKRTEGSLRQKALTLGIRLGHLRPAKKTAKKKL
jgi:hypothetical protein